MSKIENNSSVAPTPGEIGETEEIKNNNFTICPDCGSSIEILSINEDNLSIEYRCLNEKKKHKETEFTKTIEEYLKKIKENKEDNIYEEIKDKCHIENHNLNKYVSYCLDCKCHLCNECLKTKEHINHRKSNMPEIQLLEEEKQLIKEQINDYKKEVENLENINKEKTKEIEESLNKEKDEEKNGYENKIKDNDKKKDEELEENKNKYLSDVENIKKEYEEKLRIRKNQYFEDNEKIIDKFKLIKEKLEAEYNLKIRKLIENFDLTRQNLGFMDQIKNKENLLKLNELIYNTYDNYTNNYYNSMSINNLLLYYNNNTKINNKMRNILGNKYDKIINIRMKKFNEDMEIKLTEELNKTKEENKELIKRINKIEEENNKKLEEEKQKMNEIINKKTKELNDLNQQLINKNKELNEINENLRKQIDDYKVQINNYELNIKNINDKNNILDIELKKIKEENEKLKSNNGPQQNVIIF